MSAQNTNSQHSRFGQERVRKEKEPCSHYLARPARAVRGGRLFGIVFALTRRTFKLIDLAIYIHREALTKQSFLSYFDLLCVELAAHRGLDGSA